jgi:putative nucleotidyltransferase with HDIG domain
LGGLKRMLSFKKAELLPVDLKLIDDYLDEPSKFLFFQMSKIDQCHCMDVAKTILNEAGYTRSLKLDKVIKAALLHDIGKIDGDLTFCSRLFVGLVRRVMPELRRKLAKKSSNGFWSKIRYGFYVDLNHPLRGSHMARIFGIDPAIVSLIRRHHDRLPDGQDEELALLQTADNKH